MNTNFRKIACQAGFSMSQAYSAEFNKFAELLMKEVEFALKKNEANLTTNAWCDALWEIKKQLGAE